MAGGGAPPPFGAASPSAWAPASDRQASTSSSPAALAARAAFLRRFRGLCFRCLSKNHRRSKCREPLRCIECRLWGHSSSSPRCPARRRPEAQPSAVVPRCPPGERLCFPAPPPPAEMLRRVSAVPAPRRPSAGPTVITCSRFMDHELRTLRSRGVLVKAVEHFHSANPLLVGKELEARLRLPPHVLRVTRHHPEAFFIKFDFPKHRDDALRLGTITVDGSAFLLQPWSESDHAVHQTWTFHVRVCVERMPLHMWSIEGAQGVLGPRVLVDRLDSRTFGQENTAIFSCWVWCWELAHIPSSHAFVVFPEGAGRVAEMLGYSPPSRQVAPPPNGLRFDALVHLDLVEDWRVPERRTPSSGQSGVPSSNSEEEPPYPAVQPYTWAMTVPDGEGVRRGSAAGLCAGGLGGSAGGDRRRDDEDDSSSRRRRPEQERAIQRGQRGRDATPSQGLRGERHRSRSPPGSRRRWAASSPPPSGSEELPPPPPLPTDGTVPMRAFPVSGTLLLSGSPAPASSPPSPPRVPSPVSACSSDPLSDLMLTDYLELEKWAPQRFDPMAMEWDAACAAATEQPLAFSFEAMLREAGGVAHSPQRSLLGRSPSPPSAGACLQAVTHQVGDLHLADAAAAAGDLLHDLFSVPPTSVLGASPPSPPVLARPAEPPATIRRTTRQSAKLSATPVSQRASVRLARELGAIDPAEQSAAKAASGLVERFKTPLDDVDIDGLALLTRIDREAILRAASKAEVASAAAAAAH
uniref:Uncharacterized protein n=1 Tax=Avena sativa TaxID=4498 RepID=A0ACD5V8T1_AVESA